jgi:hypothetical protein
MNIFLLNNKINKSVQMLHDKHVVKMVLETTQLLSSVHHILESPADKSKIYKVTHKNHPCAVWARYSNLTYNWLIEYGLAICAEYTHRFRKIHKSQAVIEYMKEVDTSTLWSSTKDKWMEHPKCMPDKYKVNCPVQSYINYYIAEKLVSFKYTNRECPKWNELISM